MGDAIGAMLSSAIGVAISPLPLIVVVLMLATPRGKADGAAFAAGWAAALAVVTGVIVSVGGGARSGGKTATWVYAVQLVIGALFLAMSAKQWHQRPRPGHEARAPKWMAAIDAFTPAKAAGLAVLLSAANPKNLALSVGAAVSIAGSSSSGAGKTVAVVLFVLIASLCVLIPLAVYLFGGERAGATLEGWKTWMSEHNNAIMTVVLLVLGAKFVGQAISGL